MIGMLVLTMGTSTLTPLLPLYQRDFGLSTGTATLLFVTYTVTVCPTMLIAGNLADRRGDRFRRERLAFRRGRLDGRVAGELRHSPAQPL